MTHRVLDLGAEVNVFDGIIPAEKFINANEGDIIVLVRRRHYYRRLDKTELRVDLGKTEAADRHFTHTIAAAQAISDEVERMISQEPHS